MVKQNSLILYFIPVNQNGLFHCFLDDQTSRSIRSLSMQKPWIVLLVGWFVVLGSSVTPAATPLAEDTPKETVLGNTFIAPVGWTMTVREQATILTAPEGDSWIVL